MEEEDGRSNQEGRREVVEEREERPEVVPYGGLRHRSFKGRGKGRENERMEE